MELSNRALKVLMFLRLFGVARAAQIRDQISPGDKDCSNTRRLNRGLATDGLLRRYQPLMLDALLGSAPPVFTLTLKGSSILAANTGKRRTNLENRTESRPRWLPTRSSPMTTRRTITTG